jgi:hypothetical protein
LNIHYRVGKPVHSHLPCIQRIMCHLQGKLVVWKFEVCHLQAIYFTSGSCETDTMLYIQLSGIPPEPQ